MKVTVVERRAKVVSSDEWLAISTDSGFSDLVARDILNASIEKRGRGWRLNAGNHVGRALLGGVEVQIEEKVPGAFAAMVEILAPAALKIANAATPLVPGQHPEEILVSLFLASSRSYLSGAKIFEYQTSGTTGAFVSGRLDVPRTIALRARGTRHKVASKRTYLSDDVPLNRIVFAALGDVLANSQHTSLRPKFVATARALRAAFTDAVQPDPYVRRAELIEIAIAEAENAGRRREVQEVAALAGAILQAASLSETATYQGTAPRSWFLNLENFFERAVRHCARIELDGTAVVTGPILRPPLFSTLPHRYRANPDVVISSSGQTVLLDAKYKDLQVLPSTQDIHELLAHAAAYNAERAALIYPSESTFSVRPLGQSATGCELWIFEINIVNLRKSIQEVLATIGLLNRRSA